MIDHVGICVSDYDKSKEFYKTALHPLGYQLVTEFGGTTAGFGVAGKPDFWISKNEQIKPPVHVAFQCTSRLEVDAFYSAAIAAGGTDNGKPGLRPHYHPDYYGAFVLSPDGHNIEAVCHTPE